MSAPLPEPPVLVEVLTRDEGWRPHYGLSFDQPTRAIAQERIEIAQRIWPGRQYRILPATDGNGE